MSWSVTVAEGIQSRSRISYGFSLKAARTRKTWFARVRVSEWGLRSAENGCAPLVRARRARPPG